MTNGVRSCPTCGWLEHEVEFVETVEGMTVGLVWRCEACDTLEYEHYGEERE